MWEGEWEGGREGGGPACTFVRRPHALGPDSHRFPPKMRLRMNMKLMLFPKKVKVHVKVHTKTLMVLYPDSSWVSSFAQTQFGNLTDLHFDHTGRPSKFPSWKFVHRLWPPTPNPTLQNTVWPQKLFWSVCLNYEFWWIEFNHMAHNWLLCHLSSWPLHHNLGWADITVLALQYILSLPVHISAHISIHIHIHPYIGTYIDSTLLYHVSLLTGCWDRLN